MNTVTQWSVSGGESTESLPNFSQISPELKMPAGILAGLAGTSVGYAYWLNTSLGRKLETDHTWFVVFIGVAMTLLWLAMTDSKAALKAFACFFVSGLPIIFRALFLDSQRRESLTQRAMQ